MRPAGAIVLLLLLGCGRADEGPVPIAYGEDLCDVCRMFISEAPFAAEARFGPDRIEKYDDLGCLGERMWSPPGPATLWAADHSSGGWTPLESATLVHAAGLKTPMASGVAAFADRAAAEQFRARHGGRFVTWEDVKAMRRPDAK